MNLNKMTMWIVGLVVGSLLLAGLLVPTISAESWKTKEYSNVEGSAFYMASPRDYETGDVLNITWTPTAGTDSGILKVNEKEYTLTGAYAYTWAYLGLGMLRMSATGTLPFSATYTANANGTGTLVYTPYNSASQTHIIGSDGYIIADKVTDYVMMNSQNTGTYLTKDQPILFAGVSAINNVVHTFKFEYDGDTVTWDNIVPATSHVSNVNINATEIKETTDVVRLTDIKFDCTDATDYTALCTYSYGIAYAKVVGHNAHEVYASMFAVIPILAIAAIIAYAAAGIRSKY